MLIILLCTTGTGKRSNRWNVITIRMGKYMYYMQLEFEYFATLKALAVFSHSPAAYEALKSFNILQLPSRATLQSYTAFLHEQGAGYHCISEQVSQYQQYYAKAKVDGKMESKNVGALIFDEVKVISRLLWNSRSQMVIGLCMKHQQQSSLTDIYQVLNAKETVQQTSYILQFLWRSHRLLMQLKSTHNYVHSN